MSIGSQLLPIAMSASGGFVVGFIVGYAVKKALKVMIVLIGLFIVGIIFLGYYGVVTVNYNKLEVLAKDMVMLISSNSGKFVNWMTVDIPFSGSMLAGLVLGFKKG